MEDFILSLSRPDLLVEESPLVVAGDRFLLLDIQMPLASEVLLIFDLPSLLGHLDEPLFLESLFLFSHLGVGLSHFPLYHLGGSFTFCIEHHAAEGEFVVESR